MDKHILIFVLATGKSFLQDDFDVVCAVYFTLFSICPITSYSFLILQWPGSLWQPSQWLSTRSIQCYCSTFLLLSCPPNLLGFANRLQYVHSCSDHCPWTTWPLSPSCWAACRSRESHLWLYRLRRLLPTSSAGGGRNCHQRRKRSLAAQAIGAFYQLILPDGLQGPREDLATWEILWPLLSAQRLLGLRWPGHPESVPQRPHLYRQWAQWSYWGMRLPSPGRMRRQWTPQ